MRKKSKSEQDLTPSIECTSSWSLTKVKPLENYCLEVEFLDGVKGTVNMQRLILSENAGVFEGLRDKKIFNQVSLHLGVPTWPGEIDIAPDAIHLEIKKHGKCVLS